MRTASVKALIDQPEQLRRYLQERLNAWPVSDAVPETDYSYTLLGNECLVKFKLRQNDAALFASDQNSLIVERNTASSTLRENELSLISPVGNTPFNDLINILGTPDHTINKQREIFTSPDHPALRIYVDNFQGQNVLELQLQNSEENAELLLAEYFKALDIRQSQLTSLSYIELNLLQKFKGNQHLVQAMGAIPSQMADRIAALPHYKAKREDRIIQRGKVEKHGFLITAGHAIAEDTTVLGPGKLIGKFSAYVGRRTMDVTCSEDFQAFIVPEKTLLDLVAVPAFKVKYDTWNRAQKNTPSPAVR